MDQTKDTWSICKWYIFCCHYKIPRALCDSNELISVICNSLQCKKFWVKFEESWKSMQTQDLQFWILSSLYRMWYTLRIFAGGYFKVHFYSSGFHRYDDAVGSAIV